MRAGLSTTLCIAAITAACARPLTPKVPETSPLPDADADGIADGLDVCEKDKEDGSGSMPKDGCPADADGDGVLGAADRCPGAKESVNGFDDGDGCSDEAPRAVAAATKARPRRVRVSSTHIEIDEKIQFATGSAIIEPVSFALLDEVATTLSEHRDVDFVEIAGHADERGGDAQNRPLTQARATAVQEALVARGVDRRRLRAQGYSAYCPLDPGDSEAAYATNRRVEFRILRRAGSDLAQRWGGCDAAVKHGLAPASIPGDAPKSVPEALPTAEPLVAVRQPEAGDPHAALAAACDGGEALACMHLGVLLEGGAGAAPDHARAIGAFTRACERGLLHACTRLGGRELAAGRAKEAAKHFARACKGGEKSACDRLAELHADGRGVAKDDERAVELYQMACAGGDAPGCAGWGALVFAGRGTAANPTFAVALLETACARHWQPACAEAERMRASLAQPSGAVAKLDVEIDAPEPPACAPGDEEACRRACDMGVGSACTTLGVSFAYGIGVGADAGAARDLFAQGAARGDARAHLHLGLLLEGKAGVAADLPRARASFRAACDGGEAAGCTQLGRLELEGGHHAEARALFEESCDGGDGDGCLALGRMHEKGTGVVRDDDLALELYGRGCAAGSVPACSAEGVLVVETSLTASARAAGIAKVKLACEQHYQKACNELPKLERCERGGIADCEARCDEGEAAICAMLGDYHAEGRWVAASEVEARRFYRLAYDTSLGRCR